MASFVEPTSITSVLSEILSKIRGNIFTVVSTGIETTTKSACSKSSKLALSLIKFY